MQWVIASLVVLLVIQVALFIYILISKKITLNYDEKVETLYQNLLPSYIEIVQDTSQLEPRLPENKKYRKDVVEKLLVRLSEVTAGEGEKARIRKLAETTLLDAYIKILEKGSWAERVNTLFYIEDFGMISIKDHVWQHLGRVESDDENEEYRQTLRVLATIYPEKFLTFILEKDTISESLAKELFRRLDEGSLMEMEKRTSGKTPIAFKLAFIVLCGEMKLNQHLPFVERCLFDEQKEIRLKAMKSICSYQYFSKTEQLKEFFESEHWEERMYAAKIAGVMELTKYRDHLVDTLADPVWWVRFSSGEAISKLPDGEILLEYVASQNEDAFARDMANQMLTTKATGLRG
ncbi:hypothetical protein CR203_05230 [Salipaludibacillus neizhouensis]|uniref:HEAT repeat domain-containing protein n=2 Tax=Salipaludibacillus neizhouensis TaxID=885475 RepID=A0A3A9KAY4_9BACI|nr:hypothetical protein [Salipaludibacillus neizhouensis]RKL67910.1 hypothetical protein CR203_05230 [Salipaludibacillus neizhouensis]